MGERKSFETNPNPSQLCERADQLLESAHGKPSRGNGAALVNSVHVVHLLRPLLVNHYPDDPFHADEVEELGESARLYLLTRTWAGDGLRQYDFREAGKGRRHGPRPSLLAMIWNSTPQSIVAPGLINTNGERTPGLLTPADRDELCRALLEGQAYDLEQLMLHEDSNGNLAIMPRSEFSDRKQALRTEQSPMGILWRQIFGDHPLA